MTNIPASLKRLFETGEPKELDIEMVIDAYLAYRDLELGEYETADQTYDKIEDHLTRFMEWVEVKTNDDEEPFRLNDLNRSLLEQYKLWRKTDGPCEDISLVGQLSTLAVFLDFCEEFDVVDEGLSNQVPVPSVPEEEQISDEKLDEETAQLILEYLTTCEPGSRRHAEFILLWEVGMRMGAARGIDLTDCHLDEGYIELRHRPDTDTPLKNKKGGERVINVSPEVCETLKTYIIHNRKNKQDEYGREPLFTTKNGRIGLSTLRKEMYRLTSPCVYTNDCPFDRDPLNCEFTNKDHASECEGSVSPHPIRRGAIVRQLNEGIPIDDRNLAYAILSDRVDVSKKVLEKHYDPRSEMEKGRKRRDELAKHIDKYGEQVDIQIDNGVGNTEALEKAMGDESVSVDDGQSTLSNFAGVEPISIALLYVSETVKRCLARLRRELIALSPGNQIHIPSRQRATRGAIVYTMFVLLLGVDLRLSGITSLIPV